MQKGIDIKMKFDTSYERDETGLDKEIRMILRNLF